MEETVEEIAMRHFHGIEDLASRASEQEMEQWAQKECGCSLEELDRRWDQAERERLAKEEAAVKDLGTRVICFLVIWCLAGWLQSTIGEYGAKRAEEGWKKWEAEHPAEWEARQKEINRINSELGLE